MAYPQHPHYGQRTHSRKQQDLRPAYPVQRHTHSSVTSNPPWFDHPPQPFPYERKDQNEHFDIRSHGGFSENQSANRAQWSQWPAALPQTDQHVPEDFQQLEGRNGSNTEGKQFQHQKPGPALLKRSHSHDVALGIGQAQIISDSHDSRLEEIVSLNRPTADGRSRHRHPPGKTVGAPSENCDGFTRKPGEF